ncbi:MAG: hypothetical protein H0T91_05355, partial [Propionibacteriaceae bacterium]|nr:hypothetical protein [Propionibacteriaceae bacterium]
MAKPQPKAATASGNRRDKLASFEAARKKEQRRRNLGMLVICVVLALALLAYPLYLFVDDYRASKVSIGDLGASVANAGCDPARENAAKGNEEHVADGTPVTYDQHPPDSGPHYATPAPF